MRAILKVFFLKLIFPQHGHKDGRRFEEQESWENLRGNHAVGEKERKKKSFIGCIIVWLGNVSIVKR